jgi:hypothetical protein
MARSKSDTSFPFGANVAAKKVASSGKKKGGRRKPPATQKATAIYYSSTREVSQEIRVSTTSLPLPPV